MLLQPQETDANQGRFPGAAVTAACELLVQGVTRGRRSCSDGSMTAAADADARVAAAERRCMQQRQAVLTPGAGCSEEKGECMTQYLL